LKSKHLAQTQGQQASFLGDQRRLQAFDDEGEFR
jgi:hypothetical protein